MKNILLRLFVWCAGSAGTVVAQSQPTIQQLKKELAVVTADSSRSRLLYELGVQYEQIQLDSCLTFLHQSLRAAQRSRNAYATARAMQRLSYTHLYLTRNESKAIEWAKKGIAVAKPANHYVHLAKCFQWLAVVAAHQGIGNVDELSKQALLFAGKSNNWQVLSESYEAIGDLNVFLKKYKQAEIAYEQAMHVSEKHSLDHWFTVGIDYADALKRNGKTNKARSIYQQLDSMKERLPKSKGEWIYLIDVASVGIELKNYKEAERLLLEGITKERQKPKPDTLHLSFFYQNLTHLYVAQGNYKKAYESGMTLADIRQWLKDKRQTQDSKLKMTQLKATLDLEKKEKEITLLAERQKQQQFLLIGLGGIAALLIGFVGILQRNHRRIERQKAELTSLNRTKDQLMSIIAHDLRSPIGLLRDSFDLMDNNLQSPEETKQFLNQSRERIERVHGSMENLLVWALAQRNGLNPKFTPVNVANLVAEQIDALQEFANRKKITLQHDTSAHLTAWADGNQLSIVLNNLLQNAIKFTPSGGTIRVSAEENSDKQLTLQVADTGIGMDIAVWKKQQESQILLSKEGTAKEKGTGLGLFLVKEIMDKNEGTFHIESEKGLGTTVSIGLKKAI